MLDNMINGAIEKFFTNIAEACINAFLGLLTAMNSIPAEVLSMDIVNQCIIYSQTLAASILVAKFTYEIWYNNILRNSGDSEADVQGVIVRLFQTTAMVAAAPWVTKEVYAWGTAIAGDISNIKGTMADIEGGQLLKNLLLPMLVGSQNGLIILIAVAIIFAVLIYLFVLVQTFIRAAELAVVAAVGAFMALGLTNPNSQSFQTWFRELLNISLAQAIQMFLIKLSLYTLTLSVVAANPLLNVMIFCGFMWVTYKSPTILKQYIHSTGLGRAGGQAVQQAGSMIIMRKIMTRGVA